MSMCFGRCAPTSGGCSLSESRIDFVIQIKVLEPYLIESLVHKPSDISMSVGRVLLLMDHPVCSITYEILRRCHKLCHTVAARHLWQWSGVECKAHGARYAVQIRGKVYSKGKDEKGDNTGQSVTLSIKGKNLL